MTLHCTIASVERDLKTFLQENSAVLARHRPKHLAPAGLLPVLLLERLKVNALAIILARSDRSTTNRPHTACPCSAQRWATYWAWVRPRRRFCCPITRRRHACGGSGGRSSGQGVSSRQRGSVPRCARMRTLHGGRGSSVAARSRVWCEGSVLGPAGAFCDYYTTNIYSVY